MLVVKALHDPVQVKGGLEKLILGFRDGHRSRHAILLGCPVSASAKAWYSLRPSEAEAFHELAVIIGMEHEAGP